MSEPQPNLEQAVNEPESETEPVSTDNAPELAELAQKAAEARDEADAAKTRGDAAFEGWKASALRQAAGELLANVDHMPADDERYYDENGFPSVDGMRAVAEELLAERPYLAKGPRGDVHQGAKESEAEVTWSDLMNGALG